MIFSSELELPEIESFLILKDAEYHWMMKTGQLKKIKNMTTSHIKNVINTLSVLKEKDLEYIDCDYDISILRFELERRILQNDNSADLNHQRNQERKATKRKNKVQELIQTFNLDNLGSNVNMICGCGDNYVARKADLKRGWGLSCSKKCAFKVKKGIQSRGNIVI